MQKLIIFSALIACALAAWSPVSKHERQHPHQSIVGHSKDLEPHVRHSAVMSPGHNLRAAHGQLESLHHGGGTVYNSNEFKRTKKGHHEKLRDAKKGRNHLRRLRSDKHH